MWSFLSSVERRCSARAKALPVWVLAHWPGVLCCAPCERAMAMRRGARRISEPAGQTPGSRGSLRQVPDVENWALSTVQPIPAGADDGH